MLLKAFQSYPSDKTIWGENAYNQGKDRELTGTPELKQANKSHVVEVYVQHMVYALETGAETVFLHYDNASDIESD